MTLRVADVRVAVVRGRDMADCWQNDGHTWSGGRERWRTAINFVNLVTYCTCLLSYLLEQQQQ